MMHLVTLFAASGPEIHITPETLFTWHGIAITNSILYAWISSFIILVFLLIAARRVTIRPKKNVIQLVEAGTDFVMGTIENAMGSRKKAVKYAPVFAACFFFILLSNWLGLLPGVGEALTHNEVPVFRPFTADLNGTLAAATVMMVLVQYFAIKESGFAKHMRHYFSGSLKNPATYLLGIFELFSELTRIFSLALRLFLNVAIGEIIISIFSYLGHFAAPITALPFTALELFVGALQAYIFTMLTIMYLSAAIHHDEELEEIEHMHDGKATARIEHIVQDTDTTARQHLTS